MDVSHTHRINIAIDGPAGAGKSTVARKVASALQYVYIDTGAMYRAVTLKVLDSGVPKDDDEAVGRLADGLDIVLLPGGDGQQVRVNGEDVTAKLRSLEINRSVSYVARLSRVRLRMAELQRNMAAGKGVVMDGRDIGTHVLPDAELKVFLTATPRERAKRRFLELEPGTEITLDQLEREIEERDRLDREREIAPLLQAADARLLDSTGMTVDEVAEEIVQWGLAAVRTISAEEK
ncbi:(d)CMP kinase [Cohnella sp. LGH]|uniref:Cytidylate kinase n=1 Tax=Cohnella phaseoli TaxID=456490 RepID=A0A3D9IAB6_9BACL|nr:MULTISPECIES: (d)CMP kinase [Cohnella]QTH44828.1 (d)CMP kinase [Cohnella sp. LGH]RED58657.1 cytidylate kinase [Cohnella phaseoli]